MDDEKQGTYFNVHVCAVSEHLYVEQAAFFAFIMCCQRWCQNSSVCVSFMRFTRTLLPYKFIGHLGICIICNQVLCWENRMSTIGRSKYYCSSAGRVIFHTTGSCSSSFQLFSRGKLTISTNPDQVHKSEVFLHSFISRYAQQI
jgi:hypothetical protein